MAVTTKCSPQTMISFCSRQSFYRLLFGVWPFLLTTRESLLLPPSHDYMQLFLCFTLLHKAPAQCAHGPHYPKLFIKSCSRIRHQAETMGQTPQPAFSDTDLQSSYLRSCFARICLLSPFFKG